ncbi:hypothetical protein SAMN05421805_103485 [Saccharopolyspora antimicrobica]|uniref:Uncharacterized protein n=1 Tax=Saccharopolyspora antimicrobica TaxID=455193 RepID=A0A1I4XKK4_9PSEU|nr:hypothetical protein [Saccharopolyspora antimicrobica]RKT84551.1 hypothetical protein ATL45_2869 [Saccharopolyspora antimicrobica]SFN26381.1 hypothetical protein SAMN05421805_103485 [Saccharopolyspora antimicrobica]
MSSHSEFHAAGWRVDHDPRTDRTTILVGDRVSALRAPAGFAAHVHHVLAVHLQAGPVLADGSDWVLFTQPEPGAEMPVDLTELTTIPNGTRLEVPPLADSRWITPPRLGLSAPAHQVVCSATRRAMLTTPRAAA